LELAVFSAKDLTVPLNTPDWRRNGKCLLGKSLGDVKVLQFTPAIAADGKLDIKVIFTLQD